MEKDTLPGRKACALNMIKKGFKLKDIIDITKMSRSSLYLLKKSKQIFKKQRKSVITQFLKIYRN